LEVIVDNQVDQAIAEVNKVIEKMIEIPTPVTARVEKTTVDATKGGYTQHPESYTPLRLIVYVASTQEHYELLKTGEAVTWGSTPPPEGMECWIVDIPHLSWMGVKRG
jgi:hypothetical protein